MPIDRSLHYSSIENAKHRSRERVALSVRKLCIRMILGSGFGFLLGESLLGSRSVIDIIWVSDKYIGVLLLKNPLDLDSGGKTRLTCQQRHLGASARALAGGWSYFSGESRGTEEGRTPRRRFRDKRVTQIEDTFHRLTKIMWSDSGRVQKVNSGVRSTGHDDRLYRVD